jgi:hypothetical protein
MTDVDVVCASYRGETYIAIVFEIVPPGRCRIICVGDYDENIFVLFANSSLHRTSPMIQNLLRI